MKDVWCFGGSMSQSYDSNIKWFKDYVNWKGEEFKSYPELISDNLNVGLFNLSENSNNNSAIFQSICDNLINIKPESLVLIHWTPYVRFRLVNVFDEWENLTVSQNDLSNLKNINQNTVNEIFINRSHLKYEEEVRSWGKIISHSLSHSHIVFLSPDVNNGNKSLIKIHTCGLIGYKINEVQVERIIDETNGKIKDGHFSINGHKQMSHIILSLLNKSKKDII
jgi:hypothetical protein